MNPFVLTFIQGLTVLALAPLAVGLVRFFKARFEGRQGAAPWWPYVAYATLLKKQNVISTSASWMTRTAPYVVLGSAVFLALVLPLVAAGGAVAELSNFLVVTAVLALGSIFLVMGGLDAGNAMTSLGASREMTRVALLQVTIILTFAAFVVATGVATVDGLISGVANVGFNLLKAPYLMLSLIALGLIAMAENDRSPLSDPAGRAEVALRHEALVLDYSGPYLAMFEYASALKLTVFALLVANFAWPWPLLVAQSSGLDILLVIGVTLGKLMVAMLTLALLESTLATMRVYRVQEFLTASFFIALTGLVLALLSKFL